jgi:sodium/potassium-transporting ATPase subunit alpha
VPNESSRREPSFEPHRVSVDDVFARLASSRDGLSRDEATDRLRHDGPNSLTPPARASIALRIARHVGHRFALLLWAGALLAFVAEIATPGQGMGLITGALVAVVVVNAAFGFWQESRVERAMAAFRNMLSRRARVLRGGIEVDIDAAQIVAGDVIVLREGDRVPADARLFETSAIKVLALPRGGVPVFARRGPSASRRST